MRRTHVLLGLVFGLLPVAQANGQSIDFGWQCYTATFRACASLQATAIYHTALGQTEVLFRVSNLQGLPGFMDPAAGIREVLLLGLQTENEPLGQSLSVPQVVLVEGAAVASGNVQPLHQDPQSNGTVSLSLLWYNFLFGCDTPPVTSNAAGTQGVPALGGSDSTCGGHITYSAFLSPLAGRVTIPNTARAQLAWFGGAIVAEDGEQRFSEIAICTTGVNCAQVTPEPMTLALLGSGLAGIAAARRRRRRPKDDV